MIPPMSKLTFASTIIIVSLAGCSGQRADSSPATDPSDVESESTENEDMESEDMEPGSTESEEAESESAEPESAEPEATEAPAKPSPPKEPCTGLTQKTCEVTVGCEWRTEPKGCVQQ
jgi:hypothetical protein